MPQKTGWIAISKTNVSRLFRETTSL